jgi:hypothetical protein
MRGSHISLAQIGRSARSPAVWVREQQFDTDYFPTSGSRFHVLQLVVTMVDRMDNQCLDAYGKAELRRKCILAA